MSAPLVLTSDGCEFSNYFSDNIKVVEDSEVSLVKACMSIPVYAQQYITIPPVSAIDRPFTAFEFSIDGLFVEMIWSELYDSWFSLTNPVLQLTQDQFFDGTTQIPLNNNVMFGNDVTGKFTIITIREVFADFIQRPNFAAGVGITPPINWIQYSAQAPSSNKFSNVARIENSDIVINGNTYPANTYSVEDRTALEVSYMPTSAITRVATGGTPITQFVGAADPVPAPNNFQQIDWDYLVRTAVGASVDAVKGTSVGGTQYTNPNFARLDKAVSPLLTNPIDWNGGYFQHQINTMAITGTINPITGVNGGRMNIGYWQDFGLGSAPSAITDGNLDLGNCIFGLEHRYVDGATAGVAANYYETAIIDGSVYDPTLNYKVPNYVYTFRTPNDFTSIEDFSQFFIRIVRTGDISPTNKCWTFQVWTATDDTTDFQDDREDVAEHPNMIYQSSQRWACPQGLRLYFSSNNDVNEINNCKYTPTIAGSLLQLESNVPKKSAVYPAYQNGVFIRPFNYLTDGTKSNAYLEAVRKFYNGLGFAMPTLINQFQWVGDKRELGSLSWLWEIERKVNQAEVYYYIGKNNINEIIEFYDAAVPSRWRYKPTLTQMPRFLDVKINDLPINSFAGSYAKGGAEFTTSSVTKDVCSIPVPAEYLELENNFNMDISYEPYNLVYRQLHNVSDIPINQLQSELSFKDFLTNKLYKIPNINGTLKLEFHIHKHKC
jgi:hypothetical protein